MKPTDQLEPTVFVIFGGAGDLTWRKLVPALFDLSQDRSLPEKFAIIVVDRVKYSDERLRSRLHDGVNQFSRFGKAKAKAWTQFAPHIRYQQGDFNLSCDLRRLSASECDKLEKAVGHEGPPHLLHGHPALDVRRDPEIPRQGRAGARTGSGRGSSSKSRSATTWTRRAP